MKAIKILSLVLALVMLTATLAACGSYSKPSSVFADYVDETPTYTTANQLSVDGSISANRSGIALVNDYTSDNKMISKLVDLLGNKVLVEFTNTDTVTYSFELQTAAEAFYAVLITVDSTDAENVKTIYALYDQNGVKIAESDKIERNDIYVVCDLIAFGDSIYRVSPEGVITLAFERKSFEGRLPAAGDFTEDNYIYRNLSTGEIFFYDTEMNLCGYWKAPAHINLDYMTAGILANGKALVQYVITLPADAKAFDVFDNGEKKDLVTLLVDTDGDVKDLNCDYMFTEIVSRAATSGNRRGGFDGYYDESIENLAMGYEIVDGLVDKSVYTRKCYVLSNSGKVKGAIEIYDNQMFMSSYMPAAPIAKDTYIVVTAAKQILLIDGSGKLIADISVMVSMMGGQTPYINEAYLILADAIYDFSMNKLYDLKEKEMTVEAVYDRSILLEDKDGKLYLFNGTAEPALIDGDDKTEIVSLDNTNSIFAVKKTADDGKVTYTYYNDLGVAVLSDIEIELRHYTSFNDGKATVFTGENAESKSVYYVFK